MAHVDTAAKFTAADASLTRPANTTAYTANKAIGSSSSCLFTWTNFFEDEGAHALLTAAKLVMSGSGIAAPSSALRPHLYMSNLTATVLSANADQADFKTMLAAADDKLCYVDFSTFAIGGTGSDCVESYGDLSGGAKHIKAKASGKNLYGILSSPTGFTPISACRFDLYLGRSSLSRLP